MTSRPRILYLATGLFDKGGIARYTRYQIRALREILGQDSVEVLSVLPPRPGGFEDPFPVDFVGSGTGPTAKAQYTAHALVRRLLHRPGVIWCNHVRLGGLASTIGMGRAGLVINIYGIEIWSGHQGSIGRTLRRADLVVSDAHFSAAYARENFGLADERVHVVWDCVDLGRFQPGSRREELLRRHGVPDGEKYRYVLTLGRMSTGDRYKGYDRLIDAMSALKTRPYIALFAGSGDDECRLRVRVAQEGLSGSVFFLGGVHENDLPAVYNLCDVFALVSDRGPGRGEGVPLTPLEAAACGKPVIVGNEDGSIEAVIDGETGYAISPRDPAALSEALDRILSDVALRHRLGCNARKRAERDFSYEVFRQKVRDLMPMLGLA